MPSRAITPAAARYARAPPPVASAVGTHTTLTCVVDGMCRSSKSSTCPATAQRAPSGRSAPSGSPAASRVTRWSRAARVTATVSSSDRCASSRSSRLGFNPAAHSASVTATMRPPRPTICTAISSIIYRVAGLGTYPVADPEHYSYRVKLRRRSR